MSVPRGMIRTFDTPLARFCKEEILQILCKCLIDALKMNMNIFEYNRIMQTWSFNRISLVD